MELRQSSDALILAPFGMDVLSFCLLAIITAASTSGFSIEVGATDLGR